MAESVKIKHRTTNHEVYIEEGNPRKLKISINHENRDFIVHGVQDILKEVQDLRFSKSSIDKDIRSLDEMHKQLIALLYNARNFGNMEIECLESGLTRKQ